MTDREQETPAYQRTKLLMTYSVWPYDGEILQRLEKMFLIEGPLATSPELSHILFNKISTSLNLLTPDADEQMLICIYLRATTEMKLNTLFFKEEG